MWLKLTSAYPVANLVVVNVAHIIYMEPRTNYTMLTCTGGTFLYVAESPDHILAKLAEG